jgi:hypothetical protein
MTSLIRASGNAPTSSLEVMMIKKLTRRPFRLLAYGTPSVGKTTLAASSPKPVFICCEDGAREVQADAWMFPGDKVTPPSSKALREAISSLAKDHAGYETLVIDGLGALDKMLQRELCDENSKWGGNFLHEGYGKPEAMIFGRWREVIVELERANDAGLNIFLVGHAAVVNHTPPDAPQFNRYQIAVTGNKTSDTAGFFFEWCDTVAFCRFEQMTTTDPNKKVRGIGIQGARIMHLARTDSFDAKCRSKNAPQQIPMSWSELERVMKAEDLDPAVVKAQILELIPKLPADKRAATETWLATNLTANDLTLGLERIRGAVLLTGS